MTGHATTPTAQTLVSHSVTTGTGANMIIGAGTGSVAGGAVILATRATTGALVDRVTVAASGDVTMTGAMELAVTSSTVAGSNLMRLAATGSATFEISSQFTKFSVQCGGGSTTLFSSVGTVEMASQFTLIANTGGTNRTYLSTRADNHFGLGLASATPITQTFGGAEGSGTDITGGTLNIGTRGTGAGTGGRINLQFHAAGSSGSALGTLVDVLSVVAPGTIRITSIPTSSAGLSTGDVWSNGGVLTIV
jgi:hypothetical protein